MASIQQQELQWSNCSALGVWQIDSTHYDVDGKIERNAGGTHAFVVLAKDHVVYLTKEPGAKWDGVTIAIQATTIAGGSAYCLLDHPDEIFGSRTNWRLRVPDLARVKKTLTLRFQNMNVRPGTTYCEIRKCSRPTSQTIDKVNERLAALHKAKSVSKN